MANPDPPVATPDGVVPDSESDELHFHFVDAAAIPHSHAFLIDKVLMELYQWEKYVWDAAHKRFTNVCFYEGGFDQLSEWASKDLPGVGFDQLSEFQKSDLQERFGMAVVDLEAAGMRWCAGEGCYELRMFPVAVAAGGSTQVAGASDADPSVVGSGAGSIVVGMDHGRDAAGAGGGGANTDTNTDGNNNNWNRSGVTGSKSPDSGSIAPGSGASVTSDPATHNFAWFNEDDNLMPAAEFEKMFGQDERVLKKRKVEAVRADQVAETSKTVAGPTGRNRQTDGKTMTTCETPGPGTNSSDNDASKVNSPKSMSTRSNPPRVYFLKVSSVQARIAHVLKTVPALVSIVEEHSDGRTILLTPNVPSLQQCMRVEDPADHPVLAELAKNPTLVGPENSSSPPWTERFIPFLATKNPENGSEDTISVRGDADSADGGSTSVTYRVAVGTCHWGGDQDAFLNLSLVQINDCGRDFCSMFCDQRFYMRSDWKRWEGGSPTAFWESIVTRCDPGYEDPPEPNDELGDDEWQEIE